MKSKKLFLTIVMLIVSAFMALFSTGCKGSYEMTGFVVESDSVQTEYVVGEEVDFSNVEMYAVFNDGSRQDIPLNKVKIYLEDKDVTNNLSEITKTEGMKKALIFKYSTESVRFEIDVYGFCWIRRK